MTVQQTAQIMDILEAEHPYLFAGKDDRVKDTKLALWASEFASDDFALVSLAVHALIATSEKVPTVAAVKRKMYQLTHQEEMTEGEAWRLVSKAISRSGYNSVEEFAKLPPELQKQIGGPSQLKEWSMMESDIVQSVIAAPFKKSFLARQGVSREYDMLPEEVKQVAEAVGGAFAFPEQEPPKTTYQLRRAVLEEASGC